MFDIYNLKKYNFRIIIYTLSLSILGSFVINSATSDISIVKKQVLGIIISFIIMLLISFIRYDKILKISLIIYALCVVMLFLVLLMGYRPNGAGATRWIKLPIIGTIQPAEFVKIGIIIFLAWFLDKKKENINSFYTLLIFSISVGLIYLLILLEPDLSTTVVLFIISFSMLFVAGLSYKLIAILSGISIPIILSFIFLLINKKVPFLREYQMNRILAWIDPKKYSDVGAQQANSIMAIGSGQLYGKGLNNTTVNSVKNGNFLSQDQTDFIFAIIGEELGFIGSILVILLMTILAFEILNLAARVSNMQARLICTGIASLIIFQSFTNIAVATGVFPNTGLPLPFISYGVSSLMSMYIGIGLVLNVGLMQKKLD